MKQKLRAVLGPLIMVLTLAAFAYYLKNNPKLIDELLSLHPATFAILLVLYAGTSIALVLVLAAQLRLYRKKMDLRENFLLNAYSSLINFFGPGQTGPGFRAIYLKKKLGVLLRQYLLATLLYYACFAVISALFVTIGSRPWWQTILAVLGAAAVSAGVIGLFIHRSNKKGHPAPHIRGFGVLLLAATAMQLCIQAIIYYVELRSVEDSISISQAITYTGVANLAMFASLTPGAVGIREAFLLFSSRLHHIEHDTVIAASVIDRAMYLAFLGVLFLIVFGLHAQKRFQITQAASQGKDSTLAKRTPRVNRHDAKTSSTKPKQANQNN